MWASGSGGQQLARAHTLEKRTYGTDGNLLRDLGLVVDVDLVELCALDLAGELLEEGRDHAARATPRRPEVNEDGLVLPDLRARDSLSENSATVNVQADTHDLVELSLGGDGGNRHGSKSGLWWS